MKQKIITSTFTYWTFIGVLFFLAYLLFSSHIYAQTESSNLSFTQRRLNAIKEYQKAAPRFDWLKQFPEAKKYYDQYLTQLEVSAVEGDRCRENLEQQTTQQRKDCDNQIYRHFKKVRNFYRLMKYQELVNGQKNICIKADMGVNPALTARGISNPDLFYRLATQPGIINQDNPKETGRTARSTVYLCVDNAGQKKLRVRAGNGNYVKLTPQDLARPELNTANLPPQANIQELMEKLDLR